MKLPFFLIMTLFLAFTTFTACNDKKTDTTTEQSTVAPDDGFMSADPASPSATTASAGSEPHYKCPKNCEGGGAAAQGKCPVCGTDLVHNQAFHAQSATPGASPQTPIVVDPVTSTNATNPGINPVTSPTTNPAATMQPPSAQNAKGVFHYTCPKGCAGGAAGAGKCATCGGELAHNQAFHNN